MKLSETIFGRLYQHRELGQVLLLGQHPRDGATLLIEKYDEDEDEWSYHICDSCELEDTIEQEPTPVPTNWYRLLKRYMARVIDCESVAFIDNSTAYEFGVHTPEDRKLLEQIETEVRKEFNL